MRKIIVSSITLSVIAVITMFFLNLPTTVSFAHEGAVSPVKEIKPAAGETHHLEVKPESLEGHRLPYMKVAVVIIDQATNEQKEVEFHPMFGGNFHYGVNVGLQPKTYLLRFHLDPPAFARGHARENQWLVPIEAEFTFDAAVQFEKSIKIGSKETADAKILFEAEHAEEVFVLASAEKEHIKHDAESSPTVAAQRPLNQILITGIATLLIGFFLGFIVLRIYRRA